MPGPTLPREQPHRHAVRSPRRRGRPVCADVRDEGELADPQLLIRADRNGGPRDTRPATPDQRGPGQRWSRAGPSAGHADRRIDTLRPMLHSGGKSAHDRSTRPGPRLGPPGARDRRRRGARGRGRRRGRGHPGPGRRPPAELPDAGALWRDLADGHLLRPRRLRHRPDLHRRRQQRPADSRLVRRHRLVRRLGKRRRLACDHRTRRRVADALPAHDRNADGRRRTVGVDRPATRPGRQHRQLHRPAPALRAGTRRRQDRVVLQRGGLRHHL